MAFVPSTGSIRAASSSFISRTAALCTSPSPAVRPTFRPVLRPQRLTPTISPLPHSHRQCSSSPSMAIREGGQAPDFTAKDSDGNTIKLSDLRGSNVVLYFMAGAGLGCTTQSCSFRDAAGDFGELNAKIVGVSARQDGSAFRASNSLNFPIVNDADGSLQKLYEVPKTFGLIPGRYTFVIDKDGVIRKIFNSQFSVNQHVKIAKETVAAL